MNTVNTFFALISFLFFNSSFTQDFQGKAYYQTKTSVNLDQWGGNKMSAEQKKMAMKLMKNFLEKEYVLTFNKSESIYKEEEKLEAPGSRGWGTFANSFSAGPKYKNVKEKLILQDQEFFGKQFLITDSLKPLKWKMETESKMIGNHLCFKATATKTINEFDWRSMRRKNKEKSKEKDNDSTQTHNKKKPESNHPISEFETPKTTEVTAWYTTQIPINQGPDDYWGLPGLVLEVNADRTTILCTKIVMNPEEKDNIEKPTKGDVVTQKEYTDIITKKMQEMREMYGGQRGRGR